MLFNLAAVSVFLAIPTLVLAGVYGMYFFKTREPRYGLLNDVFAALLLLLLILPVLAINVSQTSGGGWLNIVTWLTVIGLLIGASGQLLLIFRKINLSTSFVTGGISLVPIVAWLCALIFLSLFHQSLPPSIGWFSIAFLLLGFTLPVAWALRKTAVPPFVLQLMITVAGWLLSLGLVLLGS